MRITNTSSITNLVIKSEYPPEVVLPGVTFHPTSREVILEIEGLPFQVKIEDEPQGWAHKGG